jgi:hypothetical protein
LVLEDDDESLLDDVEDESLELDVSVDELELLEEALARAPWSVL